MAAIARWSFDSWAQDLAPRAYVVTPIHSNAVTIGYSYTRGEIIFGSTLPIANASGEINLATVSYYHSVSFLGRSANFTAWLPYAQARYRGEIAGSNARAYRSGLMDLVLRFATNIKGAPAMPANEFTTWRQKTIIGLSLKVIVPTGQYDPSKLINPSAHRWAFKPELGLSRRWGHWLLDGYGAVWFFTANAEFFSRSQSGLSPNRQSQAPVGAVEAHLSYDVKPRLWTSFDVNYWYGGRTSVNGVPSRPTLEANSRIGGTCSVPVSKHHSFKFTYSRGARIRFGGRNYNIGVAWQYSWLGRPN